MAESKSSGKKALVIIESLAKGRTITKFLGKGYTVKACYGHVRDIASLGKGKGTGKYGIDIDNGYKPNYQPIDARQQKTLGELAKAVASADEVYLAPDPDREGEAIAWHLFEALKLDPETTRRITFNSITKNEVQKAIASPRQIDMNLVNAQQARRVLDRLVGFSLSPLLWKKLTKGLSAGRVQSVAVRMVVEREKEIRGFKPEEFWRIKAILSDQTEAASAKKFEAQLVRWKGSKLAEASIIDESDIIDWAGFAAWLRENAKGKGSFLAESIWNELSPLYRARVEALGSREKPDDELKRRLIFAVNATMRNNANLDNFAKSLANANGRPGELLTRLAEVRAQNANLADSDRFELGRHALIALLPQLIAPLDLRISRQADAESIVNKLNKADYMVSDIQEKEITSRPSPPFITSTLQQTASTFLGFNAMRTMRTAQNLYEGVEIDGAPVGLITYMRTDSTRISPEGLSLARDFIAANFTPEYLPEKPNFFNSKKGSQDAHEAIRPSSAEYPPERVKPFLSPEQYRLYDLIWRRFISSQMTNARYLNTNVTITAGEGIFEAKGRKTVFDGFTAIWVSKGGKKVKAKKGEEEADIAKGEVEGQPVEKDEDSAVGEDQELPLIGKGNRLNLYELLHNQFSTTPPPRYSEASLVKALEKEGIGRPSTYAPTVQTVQERGYVRTEKRAFHATELGAAVTELLERGFPDIMDYKFTAQMESDLDHIEEGNVDWTKMVDDFYRPFEKRCADAGVNLESLKDKPAPNGELCPLCNNPMFIRYSVHGAFLSCGKYPECKGTRPLDMASDAGGEAEDVTCPACGSPMVRKRGRFGEFYACSTAPECTKTVNIVAGSGTPLPEINLKCDLCGKPMTIKMGRRGPFVACTGYPECKNTKPLGKDGNIIELPKITASCEKCGKDMVVKMGPRGPFLSCSGYPDCKNAKPIDKEGKVIELPKITGVCEKCGKEMIVKLSRRGPFMSCVGYPKCRNAKPIPKDAKDGDHLDFRVLAAAKAKEGEAAGEEGEAEAKPKKKKAAPKKAAKKKAQAEEAE